MRRNQVYKDYGIRTVVYISLKKSSSLTIVGGYTYELIYMAVLDIGYRLSRYHILTWYTYILSTRRF